MALGGVCGVLRLDGTPARSSDERAVEGLAAAHGWRAAGGIALTSAGPGVLAAFRPPEDAPTTGPSVAVSGELHAVADARLVARSRLAALLGTETCSVGTESNDASLVLQAYRRWGEDCADRLLGDFAFVLWDGERRLLLAARDPVGVRPLHHRRVGGALWFASNGRPLATAVQPVVRSLDGYFLLDALTINLRDQARSPFASVHRLLPGHVLTAKVGGNPEVRGRRYWHPEWDRKTWSAAGLSSEKDWTEAFGALLEEVVHDHLEDASDGVAMLTSGGLDSSTIAVLAARAHRRGAMAARPVAIVDIFDQLSDSDESGYARAVVEHAGIAAEWIVADELSDLFPDSRIDGHPDSPHAVFGELSGHTLGIARDQRCRVVTTGFGGDSLFDAARWQSFDHLRRGRVDRLAPWIRGARARGVSWPRAVAAYVVPPLLSYRGRRMLDRVRGRSAYWHPPGWLVPRLRVVARSRLGEQAYRRRFRSFARQRQWEHLVGLAQHGPPIELWAAHAGQYGIEPVFPLLDRRLAAFVLAAPLAVQARPGPGGTKWLLRQATRGLLPEEVRLRPDKASWSSHVRHTVCRRLPDAFRREFGGESRLGRLGLVDDRGLRAALEGFCSGSGPGGAPAIGGLLGTAWKAERWLREVAIDPERLVFDGLEAWQIDQ